MPLPTAGLTCQTEFVMPMIRAAMIEQPRQGQPRGEAPEIAVLSDCQQQFEHEGLQRLVIDLATTCGEATRMFSEISPLSPVELLEHFAVHHAIDVEAQEDNDVLWGYVPPMVRSFFEPGCKPTMSAVLLEIDRKYGFHTSLDFIICLAYYAAAVVRRLAEVTPNTSEEILQQLENGTRPHWERLDRFEAAYMSK